MNVTHKVVINTKEDSKLRDYFAHADPGSTMTMEITGTLDEYAHDTAVVSITSVEVEPESPAPETESEASGTEPSSDMAAWALGQAPM